MLFVDCVCAKTTQTLYRLDMFINLGVLSTVPHRAGGGRDDAVARGDPHDGAGDGGERGAAGFVLAGQAGDSAER